MKIPIFENNSVRIEPYMDHFPFSFYVVLRDVEKLPDVLSDALREWFELVTTQLVNVLAIILFYYFKYILDIYN